jgi:hypothetical protein
MRKRLSCSALLILCGGFAFAQAPPQTPVQKPQGDRPANSNPPPANSQTAPNPGKLTPQMLGEMLRSASTFHELVENLHVNNLLGPDQHVVGPDGQSRHSMDRTAQTVGAGAGAGAAIGAMTHSQNGVLIGALIGAGSGMIVDQILREHEAQKAKAASAPAPGVEDAPADRPRQLLTR